MDAKTRGQRRWYCSEDCRAPQLICGHCRQPFRMLRLYVDRGQGKFCSRACADEARRRGVTIDAARRTCKRCGRPFLMKPGEVLSGKRRTRCSKDCQTTRRPIPCFVCAALFKPMNPGARFCSIGCYRRNKGETSLETIVREVLTTYGYQFRQEVKIGRWTVDFLIEESVVVEADGGYWHGKPKTRVRDAKKDADLILLGHIVVRVAEAELRKDPICVVSALMACSQSPRKTFYAKAARSA